MYEKRYSCLILKVILAMMGISTNSAQRRYENYRFILFFLLILPLVVTSEIFAFISVDTFVYKVDTILYLVGTFCFTALTGVIYMQKSALLFTYRNLVINEDFLNDDFFDICDSQLKTRIITFAAIITLCFIIWCILPFSVAYFTGAELGTLPTLPYPGAYPWKSDTVLTYMLTIFTQTVFSISPLAMYLGVILFTLYSHVFISSLAAILRSKVKKMDISLKFSSKIDEKSLKFLRNIISYHQFMTR